MLSILCFQWIETSPWTWRYFIFQVETTLFSTVYQYKLKLQDFFLQEKLCVYCLLIQSMSTTMWAVLNVKFLNVNIVYCAMFLKNVFIGQSKVCWQHIFCPVLSKIHNDINLIQRLQYYSRLNKWLSILDTCRHFVYKEFFSKQNNHTCFHHHYQFSSNSRIVF